MAENTKRKTFFLLALAASLVAALAALVWKVINDEALQEHLGSA